MIKEKYEKPFMEVVDLNDDVILTSGGPCLSDGVCDAHCYGYGDPCRWYSCTVDSSPYCPTDCSTNIGPA